MPATQFDDVDATFIAASPPRRAQLALWGPGLSVAVASVRIVLPAGSRVRTRAVPAQLVDVAELVDPLADLPAATAVSGSVRAWAVATRLALDLVARGRLVPTATADGEDAWSVGPLDPADHRRIDQLAAALPPAAHAVPLPGTSPLRVASPRAVVRDYLDAVADAVVRTPAAAVAVGHEAFAGREGASVAGGREWLAGVGAAASSDALATLRVELGASEGDAAVAVLEVRSRTHPGLVVPAVDLWAAPDVVAGHFGREADSELLLTLRRATRVWAPVGRLLDDARPDQLVLDETEVDELFGPLSDQLAAAGLPVLWPSETVSTVELRPVVTTPRPRTGGVGLDLNSLGDLHWRATIDGEQLTDEELAILAEATRSVVRMRGRWVRVDGARLRKAAERRAVRPGEVLAAALSGTLTVDGEEVEAELDDRPLVPLLDRLRAAGDAEREVAEVPGLHAELRPYQQRGVAWLSEMCELGVGGVLADDMGLGKTVQVLALRLLRHGRGPMLVVCPASVLGNWEREAARFAPGVPVRRHHGDDRALGAPPNEAIVVTTYGVARRDADLLAEVQWDVVVADEAQMVKNPTSRTARALRRIPAGARVALTGTPVENRLSDLWALLDWTTPGLLGTLPLFRRTVAVPIEQEQDPHATARLQATVRPFLLRRRKSDPTIAPELPPRTQTDQFVGLTTEQASLYRAVVEELLVEVARADGIDRRGLVLKLLTALKQICNHPAQYLGQSGPLAGRSGKLDAAVEILETIVEEGASALVFTQYVTMGRLLDAHLRSIGIGATFLHGGTPVPARPGVVDAFQAGEPPVLIISLKAGGTGLNLTRATHVLHYDRWWNPAVEDQATDRAWRIGQDRPVQVHRMVCEGTVEEKIAQLLEAKRSLADAVVTGGETWISELSDAELADLVRLGGS